MKGEAASFYSEDDDTKMAITMATGLKLQPLDLFVLLILKAMFTNPDWTALGKWKLFYSSSKNLVVAGHLGAANDHLVSSLDQLQCSKTLEMDS